MGLPQKGGPNTPATAATNSRAPTIPPRPLIPFPKDPFWQDLFDHLIITGVLRRDIPADKFYCILPEPAGTLRTSPHPPEREVERDHVIDIVSALKSGLETKFKFTSFAAIDADHLAVMKYWIYEAVEKL